MNTANMRNIINTAFAPQVQIHLDFDSWQIFHFLIPIIPSIQSIVILMAFDVLFFNNNKNELDIYKR